MKVDENGNFIFQYILNDAGQPEPCPDLDTWGEWLERAHIERASGTGTREDMLGFVTELPTGARVYTSFQAIDYSFAPGLGLWRTNVFTPDGWDRFEDNFGGDREMARQNHARVVEQWNQ